MMTKMMREVEAGEEGEGEKETGVETTKVGGEGEAGAERGGEGDETVTVAAGIAEEDIEIF